MSTFPIQSFPARHLVPGSIGFDRTRLIISCSSYSDAGLLRSERNHVRKFDQPSAAQYHHHAGAIVLGRINRFRHDDGAA